MTTEPKTSFLESLPSIGTSSSAVGNAALGHAVQCGLRAPIEALRASMESLRCELGPTNFGDEAISAVLAEVNRLGRNVQELFDYAYQPEPCALECTVNEIVYTARFHVPHEMWSSLWIARDFDLPCLVVDGPVLSRSIARLIQAAAPYAQNGVLLNVKRTKKGVAFTITYRGASDHLGDPTGLCHAIAQRDLAVIGCPVNESVSALGDTTITIGIPSTTLKESAA